MIVLFECIGRTPPAKINTFSKQYYNFIMDRLKRNLETFETNYKTEMIEDNYSGLYCLLRIAKDPQQEVIYEAATKLYEFIFSNVKVSDSHN